MRRILMRSSFLGACSLLSLSLHCGGDEPTQAEWCEDTSNEAGLRSYAAISSAGRSCSTDADCVVFRNPLTCVSGCGQVTPIASAAVPDLERNLQALSDAYCAPYEEKECLGPIALPCIPPEGREVPACGDDGRCSFVIIPWDELEE
jgi:hypothetical protein